LTDSKANKEKKDKERSKKEDKDKWNSEIKGMLRKKEKKKECDKH
jgi:hypothetical protein